MGLLPKYKYYTYKLIYKTKMSFRPKLNTVVVNFTILAAILKILAPLKLKDFLQLSKNVVSRPQETQKKSLVLLSSV